MSQLTLLFAIPLMWIPAESGFVIVALFVYSCTNLFQASYLWCQLLSFMLLFNDLQSYSLVLSSCEKVELAIIQQRKIDRNLTLGLCFLIILKVGMLALMTYYLLRDGTIDFVCKISICIMIAITSAIEVVLCFMGTVITAKLYKMVQYLDAASKRIIVIVLTVFVSFALKIGSDTLVLQNLFGDHIKIMSFLYLMPLTSNLIPIGAVYYLHANCLFVKRSSESEN